MCLGAKTKQHQFCVMMRDGAMIVLILQFLLVNNNLFVVNGQLAIIVLIWVSSSNKKLMQNVMR